MMQLTELNSWVALKDHAHNLRLVSLNHLHTKDASRNTQFTASANNIHLNFSNQRIEAKTLELLLTLAKERRLNDKIHDLLQGKPVNVSENRPALHTALRKQDDKPIYVNGEDIMPGILQTRQRMRQICEQIRSGLWLGFSGKPIINIVNIGIGGSDLGPKFCFHALKEFAAKTLNYFFISDADPIAFESITEGLSPDTTLFILSSKSFTTQETLYNTHKAIAWLGREHQVSNHLIAVTANEAKARQLGITHILPIWDWIGGRYSACSAINLITAIALGFEQFNEILIGANNMDTHFEHAEWVNNLPILLALLGIWNINFMHCPTHLILTYSQRLTYLVPYLQQLDMESNGKSIDNQGLTINYATSPIVWGGSGNQAQHSYYQLLCQGRHTLSVDCVTLEEYEDELVNEVFRTKNKVLTLGVIDDINPHRYIPGNTTLNCLSLGAYCPNTIGALISLYEHKTYVQSVIWDINPFDQPGVDRSKCEHIKTHNLISSSGNISYPIPLP